MIKANTPKTIQKLDRKGIVLFIVLGTIFIVLLLANIILNLFTSQARLTHHQVSRIQAYYASMAGVNYAIEKLRLGTAGWVPPSPDDTSTTTTNYLCKSASSHANCSSAVIDDALPGSIQYVEIKVTGTGSGLNNTRKISAKTTYTYTP